MCFMYSQVQQQFHKNKNTLSHKMPYWKETILKARPTSMVIQMLYTCVSWGPFIFKTSVLPYTCVSWGQRMKTCFKDELISLFGNTDVNDLSHPLALFGGNFLAERKVFSSWLENGSLVILEKYGEGERFISTS